jgi:lipopolysaccharide export system permease protein
VSLGGALLGLHGGAFVLALALLWWRDYGSTRGWLRRPANAAA